MALIACVTAFAQDAAPSLADAAKKSRAEKPKAKIVVTEETLQTRKRLFPDIVFEGDMNSDEIVASIREYRTAHTMKETEDAVHEWFTYFDDMMVKLARENNQINATKVDRDYDPDSYPNDYRLARQQMTHDIVNDKVDRRTVLNNAAAMGRIQQTLIQVRNVLYRYNWRFDWMKIHTTNGIQTF